MDDICPHWTLHAAVTCAQCRPATSVAELAACRSKQCSSDGTCAYDWCRVVTESNTDLICSTPGKRFFNKLNAMAGTEISCAGEFDGRCSPVTPNQADCDRINTVAGTSLDCATNGYFHPTDQPEIYAARSSTWWRIDCGGADHCASNMARMNAFYRVGACGGVGNFSAVGGSCDCPAGSLGEECFGDDTTCNGGGTVNAAGACTCRPETVGARCYTDSNWCNSQGVVDENGSCTCNAFRHGARCEFTFTDDATCNGRGIVNGVGTCTCIDGVGPNCQHSDGETCSGLGTANATGHCVCSAGATGESCQYTDALTCNGQGRVRVVGNSLVPIAASNSDVGGNSGIALASSSVHTRSNQELSAWKAFNRNQNGWLSGFCLDGVTGWLQVSFPVETTVTGYRIMPRSDYSEYTPRAWTFEGRAGGSDGSGGWEVVDTRVNQLVGAGNAFIAPNIFATFELDQPGTFTAFRIVIRGNNGRPNHQASSLSCIQEMELIGPGAAEQFACDCTAGGVFSGPSCSEHSCGGDLMCYLDSSTDMPDGAPDNPAGSFGAGATPRQHGPFMTVHVGPVADTAEVRVVVRGPGASTATPDDMAADDFITNIWVTDQSGDVRCFGRWFPSTAGGAQFAVAGSPGTVLTPFVPSIVCRNIRGVRITTGLQAHAYGPRHGLWSGPLLNTRWEMAVSVYEATTMHPNGTSLNPTGPQSFHVTAGSNDAAATGMAEHEPYVEYDASTQSGRVLVLGEDRRPSRIQNPNDPVRVEALWIKNQHGAVVAYREVGREVELEFTLNGSTPAVTAVMPYAFSHPGGLFRGADVLSVTRPPTTAPTGTPTAAPPMSTTPPLQTSNDRAYTRPTPVTTATPDGPVQQVGTSTKDNAAVGMSGAAIGCIVAGVLLFGALGVLGRMRMKHSSGVRYRSKGGQGVERTHSQYRDSRHVTEGGDGEVGANPSRGASFAQPWEACVDLNDMTVSDRSSRVVAIGRPDSMVSVVSI